MIRFSSIIDWLAELPLLPVAMTSDNPHKAVRVCGLLVYFVWFMPAVLLWFVAAAVLAIPAMIQDA